MADPVLVPLDGSPLAERVLPHVLAVTRGTTPHLDLARVLVPPTLAGDPTPTDPIAWRLARDEATAYLDGVRHALAPNGDAHAGLHDVTAHVLEGDPAGSLLAFARERGTALVALSSHGRSGLAGWNLGGVGHKVADHARSHLLVVRAFDDAPVRDADGRVRTARYRLEPYVLAADVYGWPPHVGRGGWSWYTGSAGWAYRLAVEGILGLHREGDALRVAPHLPPAWPEAEVAYRFGATTYRLSYRRGAPDAPLHVTCDGRACPDARVPLRNDGAPHAVHARVPAVGTSAPGGADRGAGG
ncbi:MAG: universal stress protein [Trueperaceae bacterium]|nr:universal stress protein [Trueperaceae bacterium]